MKTFFLMLVFLSLNSLLGFIGIFTYILKERTLKRIVFFLVAFSAGTLLGGAFFHLMKEAIGYVEAEVLSLGAVAGFIIFFFVEEYFHWHSCKECEIHPFAYTMLVGDGIHNFIDGLVVAASFIMDIQLGIITALLVMIHEVPQQLGVYGVLVHGGHTKEKSLIYSFSAQLMSVIGGVVGYVYGISSLEFSNLLVPFAAGGFIYIASSDLVPEIHRMKKEDKIHAVIMFLIGLGIMFALGKIG